MNDTRKYITLDDRRFERTITFGELSAHMESLAARINADYVGVERPLFIGVLNGAFMFFAELLRRVEFDCEVAFVRIASYEGLSSTGGVRELMGLTDQVAGRHIIVVEDIVETGTSIAHIMEMLYDRCPASVEIATLLFKPDSYKQDHTVKYAALEIPDDFVIGFGLDYRGLGRNLPDIYKLSEE